MTRLAVLLSTFGYVGFFPFAPGTAGSVAGLAVYAGLVLSGGVWLQSGVLAVLLALGVWGSGRAEAHFGATDPGPVVIDEVVGMLITLFLVPVTASGALVGFLIFRVFDIVKPFPAGRLEQLPGGLGIMADDVMAAVYANLALRLAAALVPGLTR